MQTKALSWLAIDKPSEPGVEIRTTPMPIPKKNLSKRSKSATKWTLNQT